MASGALTRFYHVAPDFQRREGGLRVDDLSRRLLSTLGLQAYRLSENHEIQYLRR